MAISEVLRQNLKTGVCLPHPPVQPFHSVWGLGVGSVYAVVTPTGHLLYRIAAGTKALVGNHLASAPLFLEWRSLDAVREGDEPKVGDMTVTFVQSRLSY